MFGLLGGRERHGGTVIFLATTVATSVNVFVGVVQAFQKVPALAAMAPYQTELPFVVTQLIVLALFIALTIGSAKRFRGGPMRSA